MKKKTIAFIAFIVTVITFCGCKGDEVKIQSIGGGTCLFVNHNTKDSVLVNSGISIGVNSDYIYVRSGDVLEITFIPEPDFEKYVFDVVYTLMDGTQHSYTTPNYTYKFTISDWGNKDGKILFNAKSRDENTNITAGGSISVKLVDND